MRPFATFLHRQDADETKEFATKPYQSNAICELDINERVKNSEHNFVADKHTAVSALAVTGCILSIIVYRHMDKPIRQEISAPNKNCHFSNRTLRSDAVSQ